MATLVIQVYLFAMYAGISLLETNATFLTRIGALMAGAAGPGPVSAAGEEQESGLIHPFQHILPGNSSGFICLRGRRQLVQQAPHIIHRIGQIPERPARDRWNICST